MPGNPGKGTSESSSAPNRSIIQRHAGKPISEMCAFGCLRRNAISAGTAQSMSPRPCKALTTAMRVDTSLRSYVAAPRLPGPRRRTHADALRVQPGARPTHCGSLQCKHRARGKRVFRYAMREKNPCRHLPAANRFLQSELRNCVMTLRGEIVVAAPARTTHSEGVRVSRSSSARV